MPSFHLLDSWEVKMIFMISTYFKRATVEREENVILKDEEILTYKVNRKTPNQKIL